MNKEVFEHYLILAGLTKKKLADILGVGISTISTWTSKGKNPPYWFKSWIENYIAAQSCEQVLFGNGTVKYSDAVINIYKKYNQMDFDKKSKLPKEVFQLLSKLEIMKQLHDLGQPIDYETMGMIDHLFAGDRNVIMQKLNQTKNSILKKDEKEILNSSPQPNETTEEVLLETMEILKRVMGKVKKLTQEVDELKKERHKTPSEEEPGHD